MHDATDEQLFVRYRGGEPEGLEALVRRYERPLFVYLNRYLGDRHLAEDVFQDTFLRLARAAAEYDPRRPFRPWLYTIAANLARDLLRQRKAHRTVALLDAPIPEYGKRSRYVHDAEQPVVAAAKAEEARAVRDGVASLAPDFQQVVRLHFFDGLKYREVAQELAIPVGTVKSRIHSARRQLKTYWLERFGDTGIGEWSVSRHGQAVFVGGD